MNQQNIKDLTSIQAQLQIVLMYLERDVNSADEYTDEIKEINNKLYKFISKYNKE